MTASAKTPVNCADGVADGVLEVAVVMLLDQVGDDFGVGFGDEVVAFGSSWCLRAR